MAGGILLLVQGRHRLIGEMIGISGVTSSPRFDGEHGCWLAAVDGEIGTSILSENAYFLAMKPGGRSLGCRHLVVQR